MEHWPVLQRFWERACSPAYAFNETQAANHWHDEVMALQGLGIGVEAALQFLHFQRPELESYRQWLYDNQRMQPEEVGPEQDDVLSADDLAFWEQNGYVIVKQAVSQQQCAEARDAIWEFLGASPEDPSSWYKPHDARRGLMVSFFDHPALDINRRSGRIRKAYEQLYGSKAIYKTIDKVSFNPPECMDFRFIGSALHWDVSLVLPISDRLQGLLYLTDCTADDGAFHCVPGFQHRIGEWLASLPPEAEPRALAPRELKAVPVPAAAGDFIIWHQALPHCATPNRGTSPRLVQYLTYLPEAAEESKPWV